MRYDDTDVIITATELTYSSYQVSLELLIENNRDEDIRVRIYETGAGGTSINGYMFNGAYLYTTVTAGKKATDGISFYYDELLDLGINQIADLEISFDIFNDDYDHDFTGPLALATDGATTYDYDALVYQKHIQDKKADFKRQHFATDLIYDIDDIAIVSEALITSSDMTILMLEAINVGDEVRVLELDNVTINGLNVASSFWLDTTVNAGKRAVLKIDLSEILPPVFWEVYGIDTTLSVRLTLEQTDGEFGVLVAAETLEIMFSDEQPTLDTTGEEHYDDNGIRIVSKAILMDEDSYWYSIYVLLLVENNSGSTIDVGIEYNSLSVNGFMTDYFAPSGRLVDGDFAALLIELYSSSFEDNNIEGVDDIEEVEFVVFIEGDAYHEIDQVSMMVTP